MDQAGREDIHNHALDGDLRGVEARLRAGDDVSAADHAGDTPLHFAAQQQRWDVVRLLLAGAEVDAQDRYGNTPLWRAIFNSRGHGEIAATLLDAGANPDLINRSGVTPRQLAERMGLDLTGLPPPAG